MSTLRLFIWIKECLEIDLFISDFFHKGEIKDKKGISIYANKNETTSEGCFSFEDMIIMIILKTSKVR